MNRKKIFAIGKMVLENKDAIAEVLRSNLSKDLIEKKRVFVHEEILFKALTDRFAGNSEIALDSLACRHDHIEVKFNVNRARAKVGMFIRFRIIEAVLGRGRQMVRFRISDEKLVGENIMGKIAATMTHIFVKDIIKTGIGVRHLESLVSYSPSDRMVSIDLSRVEKIREMFRSDRVHGGVLDHVTLHFGHENSGIAVTAAFDEKLARFTQGPRKAWELFTRVRGKKSTKKKNDGPGS